MKCLARLTESSTRKNSAEFCPCISEYMVSVVLKILYFYFQGIE